MRGREELAALLFELQRARGPVEKARAAARAWRTLRELSPAERRMIAREIGSSGAEELLESLGRGGHGFSPAAVIEALTRVEEDDGTSLDEIVADLRGPRRRVEAVTDALDAAADLAITEMDPHEELAPDAEDDGAREAADPELRLPPVPTAGEPAAPVSAPEGADTASPEGQTMPPAWEVGPAEPLIPQPTPPVPPPRPPVPPAPRPGDGMLRRPVAAAARTDRSIDAAPDLGALSGERPASVLRRLRELRARRDDLASARLEDVRHALDEFPEPWARRRALSFLLAAGIPADIGAALDLVGDLTRPTDRRWCLGVLADLGRLDDEVLERALELVPSPAAKHRLARRARSAIAVR